MKCIEKIMRVIRDKEEDKFITIININNNNNNNNNDNNNN